MKIRHIQTMTRPNELHPLYAILAVGSFAGIPLFLAWVTYRAIRKVMHGL